MNPLEILREYFSTNDLWEKTLDLKRGEWLQQAGDMDHNLYYVEKGTIYYSVSLEEEREQIIRFGYQGDFIAAMDTFLQDRPTVFDSRALRRCRIRMISRDNYINAVRKNAELRKVWDIILRGLYVSQLERELDLLTNDLTERYLRVARRSPRLFQEIPAKYIANYLSMTPETLSRIRASTPIS